MEIEQSGYPDNRDEELSLFTSKMEALTEFIVSEEFQGMDYRQRRFLEIQQQQLQALINTISLRA